MAELERALGVLLVHRTTRRLHLSDIGAAYAERCAEIVRMRSAASSSARVRTFPRLASSPTCGSPLRSTKGAVGTK